jgi:serine protease inhibitor
METSSSLIEPLTKLGVKKLFAPNAELGYMTQANLQVTEVKQQTSIDVDEKGSVLVSVTKITAVGLTVQRRVENRVFVVDRPFLAMIVHVTEKVPYVIVKVSNPKY